MPAPAPAPTSSPTPTPSQASTPRGRRTEPTPKSAVRVAPAGSPPVQLTPQLTITIGGKTLYRMRNGKLVELPEGMTVEEAARLEAEAQAALQRLGKGPPPKPVPDAKKLAKKEE